MQKEDKLIIGGHEFHSRFILGSGKYSLKLIEAAVKDAGAEIITLAVRRANTKDQENILDFIQIDDFATAGIDKPFVQDNQSRSTKGVLRGLHFQKNHTQGKLVRVTMGEVYDVAVDCRPNSKTFGKWVGVTLSAENKKMFYIPEGFAHGFLVLSDVAEFCYKCTDVYDPTAEGGIPYDDPTVNVQWPDCGCEHKTSAKDKEHTPFAEQKFEYFEKY